MIHRIIFAKSSGIKERQKGGCLVSGAEATETESITTHNKERETPQYRKKKKKRKGEGNRHGKQPRKTTQQTNLDRTNQNKC
jgi:hypothetical protein